MNRSATAILAMPLVSAVLAAAALGAGNANWLTEVGNPGISRTAIPEASKVLTSVVFEGDLVVGGFFGLAGGQTALHVARWDGADWAPIGSGAGLTGRVNALDVFNGQLYAGGTFTERAARYNGTTEEWEGLFSLPDDVGYTINAIASEESFVYMCGSTDAGIIQYDGNTFSQIGVGAYDLNVALSATMFRGQLIVGGTEGAHILAWNGGTWSPLAEADPLEPDKQVQALFVLDDVLYAAGAVGADGAPEFNWIAAWDGVSWSAVGNGRLRRGLIGPQSEGLFVTDITSYQGDLVVCGTFTMLDDVPANHIIRWTGSEWRPMGSGVAILDLKRYPNTMIEHDGSLFVGGSGFEVAGGKTAYRIAEWRDDPTAFCVEWGGVDAAFSRVVGAIVDSVEFDPALPDGESTYLPLELPDRAFGGSEYATIRGDSLICRLDGTATGVDGRIVLHLERRFRLRGDVTGPVSGTIPFRLTGLVDFVGAESATGGFYSIALPNTLAFDSHDDVGVIDDLIPVPFTNLDPDVEHVAVIDFDVQVVSADGGISEYVMTMPETFLTAGFDPLVASVGVDEGASAEYTISMRAAPSAPVTVQMTATPPTPVTPTASVTFTTQNWTTPRTVTLDAADDFVDRTYSDVTISHTITGAPEYAGLTLSDVVVSIADNDEAGILASDTSLVVVEGEGDSYMISLASEPTASVTVSPTSSDPAILQVVGTDLVFVPETWFVPQTVTVQTDDDFAAGDRAASVIHSIISGDTLYDALTLPDVDVTILDNDVIAALVTFDALNVGEGVWLSWEYPKPLDPTAVVTIRYAFDAPPATPIDGAAVENGADGVFSLAVTDFVHDPMPADSVYYAAFVSTDAATSPRATVSLPRVFLTVDQQPTETRIEVIDVAGVDVIEAAVRLGGESAFSPDPLSFDRDDAGWFLILSPALTANIRGVEFFVTLSGAGLDEDVTVGSSSRPERVANTLTDVAAPAQVATRYRMVSAPLIGVDGAAIVSSLNDEFGEQSAATWKVRRWNDGGYDPFDAATPPPFRPGEAYWVITVSEGTWTMSGTTNWPRSDGYFDVILRPGWNMVGNPAGYTVSLSPSAVRVIDGGVERPLDEVTSDVLSGNFYGPVELDPETTELLSTLDPFGGMWVHNSTADQRDLTLRLPAIEVSGLDGRGLAYTSELAAWIGEIDVRTASGVRTVERVIEYDIGPGSRSVAKPPVTPAAPVDVAIVAAERYAVWVTRDGDTEDATLEVVADEPLEISTHAKVQGGAPPHHLVLVHADGRRWDTSVIASITLPAGRHRLAIEVGTGEPSPPPRVAAARVVPNPIRAGSWVDLDAPSAGRALLQVFDVSGRRLWRDARRIRSAGRHAIRWDALSATAGMPNGLYWLTLEFRADDTPALVQAHREKVVVLR